MMNERFLYKRVEAKIMQDFSSFLDGEALPGERELASIYSVTRSVIQYALRDLAEQGLVYRIKGKGTFMQRNTPTRMNISDVALQGTQGIAALVRSYGIKVKNEVLVSGIIKGNRFLEDKLEIPANEPIFALHRVRYGNNEPLAIEYSYVPKKLLPDIETMDFKTVSLYEYMESRGCLPSRYDRRFRVKKLFPKEARYLELPVDAPAFYFELIGVDEERHPVEYTESYVRCDRAEFSFTTRL